jgi:hypothetical protein
VGPWRIASWVVATAERYAASRSSRFGVHQAQAMEQWKGELVRRGAIHAGLRQNGEGAVYRFALIAHHRRANVLPCAAPGQVWNALMEAAVKKKPAVLVPHEQCQELIHQMAGSLGTAFGVCGLEGGGANGG